MSASSDDPQVSQVVGGVYSEAQPYISDIMQESARLYGSDVGRNYYPGSTVVDFSPQSRSALDLQQAQGFAMTGDSPFYDMAATTFGGLASGAAGDANMNRGLGLGLGFTFFGKSSSANSLTVEISLPVSLQPNRTIFSSNANNSSRSSSLNTKK